jgi:hypothetical protein
VGLADDPSFYGEAHQWGWDLDRAGVREEAWVVRKYWRRVSRSREARGGEATRERERQTSETEDEKGVFTV